MSHPAFIGAEGAEKGNGQPQGSPPVRRTTPAPTIRRWPMPAGYSRGRGGAADGWGPLWLPVLSIYTLIATYARSKCGMTHVYTLASSHTIMHRTTQLKHPLSAGPLV